MGKTLPTLVAVALAGCVNPLEAEVRNLKQKNAALNKECNSLYAEREGYHLLLHQVCTGQFELLESVDHKPRFGNRSSRITFKEYWANRLAHNKVSIHDNNMNKKLDNGDKVYIEDSDGNVEAKTPSELWHLSKKTYGVVTHFFSPESMEYSDFKSIRPKDFNAAQRNYSGRRK